MKKIIIVLLATLLVSCSDEEKIYYEITDNEVLYHSTHRLGQEFYLTAHITTDTLKDVDHKTFKQISKWYGADVNHVYYEATQLKQRDPSTFNILTKLVTTDKHGAYFDNKLIKNSDGLSFKIIQKNYATDANQTYFINEKFYQILKGADQNSLKIIEETYNSYAQDKNKIYFKGIALEHSDPETFEILKYDFSKDDNSVYFKNEKLENATSHSFRILDSIGLIKYDYYYNAEDDANLYKGAYGDYDDLEIRNKAEFIEELANKPSSN